ncbi:hypothetical protein [Candidatus Enterovibrio altilux]|uniref:Uncharacterized protein n=1 Tax=Candidatus Enterovibrio altilux TaxID=1927128 RepID=A0A291BAV8_9GAMM|nr:hypothetical protein [Candidatus Enterovibrio luxaltus]ATF10105.1 hypothetical protein BTN50_1669 [Candidatus Enterovibrio luxaltus]
MSAIFLTLSCNASASLLEATQTVMRLGFWSGDACTNEKRLPEQKFLDAINTTISTIQYETTDWGNKYYDIIESDNQICYFDEISMHKLNDAVIFVRCAEEMLRIQVESTFTCQTNVLTPEVLSAIGQLKVTVQQLRISVESIIKVELKLQREEATDEASFDAFVETLQAMKKIKTTRYH